MSIGQYALVNLAAAKTYLGDIPRKSGLWLYCPSPTGATAATAEVTATTLVLIITGGASAGTTTITFSDSDSDTISELIDKINALTGKWVAGAICNGSASSTDLVVTGAQSALGSASELTLLIEDNYGVERAIDRATDFIERFCNRKFYTRTYSREQYQGSGREALVLRNYPVTRVFRVSAGVTNTFSVTNTTAKNFASVEVNATTLKINADGTVTSFTLSSYATINLLIAAINATSGWTATLIAEGTRSATYTGAGGSAVSEIVPMPAQRCLSPNVGYVQVTDDDIDDYWISGGGTDEDRDSGILIRAGGWSRLELFFVDYIAGYSTVPAALEEACLMLIKHARDRQSHDTNVSHESLGDYSYTLRDLKEALPESVRNEVSLFRAFEF